MHGGAREYPQRGAGDAKGVRISKALGKCPKLSLYMAHVWFFELHLGSFGLLRSLGQTYELVGPILQRASSSPTSFLYPGLEIGYGFI